MLTQEDKKVKKGKMKMKSYEDNHDRKESYITILQELRLEKI